MENYQMGRPCGRPYRTTCGMNRMPAAQRMAIPEHKPMPAPVPASASTPAREDAFPVAMGYVPCQHFSHTFELCHALQMGTIFPELCKPFCGKRGMCR